MDHTFIISLCTTDDPLPTKLTKVSFEGSWRSLALYISGFDPRVRVIHVQCTVDD